MLYQEDTITRFMLRVRTITGSLIPENLNQTHTICMFQTDTVTTGLDLESTNFKPPIGLLF